MSDTEPSTQVEVVYDPHDYDTPEKVLNTGTTTPQPPNTTAAVATVAAPGPLVEPVASLDTIEAAYKAYEALCDRLLDTSDWQDLGRGKGKFVKKSGWRKLAVAMGVSVELRSVDTIHDEGSGKVLRSTVTARAIAPNGRSMDGIGACSVDERRFSSSSARERADHDIPATAATRATNRACADLFGFGAVSAEEMDGGGARGDYGDEPKGDYRTSSMRDDNTQRQAEGITEPQTRLIRTRMGIWRKEQDLDSDTFPKGWTEAKLPWHGRDLLKNQVDTVLELVDRATTTGETEQRPEGA